MKQGLLIDARIRLEMLVTEREGMVAENMQRQACGLSMAYSDEAFAKIHTAMAIVLAELRQEMSK